MKFSLLACALALGKAQVVSIDGVEYVVEVSRLRGRDDRRARAQPEGINDEAIVNGRYDGWPGLNDEEGRWPGLPGINDEKIVKRRWPGLPGINDEKIVKGRWPGLPGINDEKIVEGRW
eukprot:Trichotokara_eunicae@DN6169_c0_g1_i4.p3